VNYTEFTSEIADIEKLSVAKAKQFVDTVFEEIGDAMRKGDEVNIPGFGKFSMVKKDARMGRNPATGESIEIAAKNAPKFAPAGALKEKMNRRRR
jgi:DNA-binding protein HU-beta